jgi:hypothetical protein
METVFYECKKCDAPVGRFVNLWTQIGKSYFSPVVEPEDDLAVQSHGAVRIGERGTLVEEWSALSLASRLPSGARNPDIYFDCLANSKTSSAAIALLSSASAASKPR